MMGSEDKQSLLPLSERPPTAEVLKQNLNPAPAYALPSFHAPRRLSLPTPPQPQSPISALFTSPYFRRTIFTGILFFLCVAFLPMGWLHSPSSFFLSGSELERAIYGRNVSLTTYLDTHFPIGTSSSFLGSRREPHIWLTMADVNWVDTGAAGLHEFVTRLNAERRADGRGDKDTVLVVMCIDEICVDRCAARGMNCYGGFMYNRPEQMLPSTWPKVAGLIEVLQTRDAFFVDSDVAFKMDPYPYMEPLMEEFDIVAQENDAYDHFNTGWIWFRQTPEVVEAWREVFAMDMRETSRDQYNFNTVLETNERRLWAEPNRGLRPIRSNYTAANGLKVHVLNDKLFRSYHFERDRGYAPRDEAVYIHMTCADDLPLKFYVPKALGFGGNVDNAYSSPPRILSISHLSGTTDDLTQRVKIALAATYYTKRAFEPPAYVTFTDLLPPPEEPDHEIIPVRRSYAGFPFAQMSDALGLQVLEPDYSTHAIQHILGESVLDPNYVRVDQHDFTNSDTKVILELQNVADFDMRQAGSFIELLAKLSASPVNEARSVRLINFELGGNWREWELPGAVAGVKPCARVDIMPACGQICRGDEHGIRIKLEHPWVSPTELTAEFVTIPVN